MPEKTQQDITKEAFQQTAPEISKTKKKYRRFIDTAFFVTLLTISLFIVQYVFFKNYLNVYTKFSFFYIFYVKFFEFIC